MGPGSYPDSMTLRSDLTSQEAFVARFAAQVGADDRVQAAWLEGCLGRGLADRYSDVDLHFLTPANGIAKDAEGMRAWLGPAMPTVFARLLFGEMFCLITDDGLPVDIWQHCGDSAPIERKTVRLLKENPGALIDRSPPPTPDPAAVGDTIPEFWRCINLLPCVLGRDERLVAWFGASQVLRLTWDILIAGRGTRQVTGAKNVNCQLNPGDRAALETILANPGSRRVAIAQCQLEMAALISQAGPGICERAGIPYRAELERAVRRRVQHELELMGLSEPRWEPE
jgi:hypothetical protein